MSARQAEKSNFWLSVLFRSTCASWFAIRAK